MPLPLTLQNYIQELQQEVQQFQQLEQRYIISKMNKTSLEKTFIKKASILLSNLLKLPIYFSGPLHRVVAR
jgi:hypothetical protein